MNKEKLISKLIEKEKYKQEFINDAINEWESAIQSLENIRFEYQAKNKNNYVVAPIEIILKDENYRLMIEPVLKKKEETENILLKLLL